MESTLKNHLNYNKYSENDLGIIILVKYFKEKNKNYPKFINIPILLKKEKKRFVVEAYMLSI